VRWREPRCLASAGDK